MRKRLITQGIRTAEYETTTSDFRNPEKAKEYQKCFKLLDREQELMGSRYRVTLEVRNYGDTLLPFFSYQRRSEVEMKTEETLKRVRKILEKAERRER
jgi:hypothetical protein